MQEAAKRINFNLRVRNIGMNHMDSFFVSKAKAASFHESWSREAFKYFSERGLSCTWRICNDSKVPLPPKLLFHVSKRWRILKKNWISWILRCLEESRNFVHSKTVLGTSSTELGIAESHFEKQSRILSQQFPLVEETVKRCEPIIFTNNFMASFASHKRLWKCWKVHFIFSTHQVIIFLQAGSRWQTWRPNSM